MSAPGPSTHSISSVTRTNLLSHLAARISYIIAWLSTFFDWQQQVTANMLLLEELPGFLTVLINLHMRFDSTYVQKEPVNFTSLNPVGDCPGSLNGAMRDPDKCLVVIQEWWGMNEQIKQQALDIAGLGSMTTIVPDLYRGIVAENSTEAFHLVTNLDYAGKLIHNEHPYLH